jgi:hypothetical protein
MSFKIKACIVFGLILLAFVAGALKRKYNPHKSAQPVSDQIQSSESSKPKETTNNNQSKEIKTSNSPPTDAWATREQRDLGGALFIKPYLRQLLKDPDSLQDFEVIDARRNKKLPGSYRVTVFYRARNSFGALVAEQRTVTMVYNPTDDSRPWVISSFR